MLCMIFLEQEKVIRNVCGGGGGVRLILNRVNRVGYIGKVIFEQRPESGRELAIRLSRDSPL